MKALIWVRDGTLTVLVAGKTLKAGLRAAAGDVAMVVIRGVAAPSRVP